MKEYKRITVFEREEISIKIEQKVSIRTIAKYLGRSSSTISRELSRHYEKGVYRAIIAQEKVQTKLKASKLMILLIKKPLEKLLKTQKA